MRRRRKEFGLYHMLGMGKGNLGRVLLWESGMLMAMSLTAGLLGGILLSKLAELGLTRVLQGEISYAFYVDREALLDTLLIFFLIFVLIFWNGLRQIRRMSAVDLMKSENVGEKPPRANYLLGAVGIAILGLAYYIAVSIQNPLLALSWFFVAVGMVIVATYLLFIAGSVACCRLLQKNKRYYYRKNHFVSVSSMVYRMKRNGAGLASVCVLSTMVLVMLLGSGSLYFGAEDMLYQRFPRDLAITVDYRTGDPEHDYSREKADYVLAELDALLQGEGIQPEEELCYLSASAEGVLQNGQLVFDPNAVNADMSAVERTAVFCFVPLEDYNRCMGADETLEEGEALLYCIRTSYDASTITAQNGTSWRIKKQVEHFTGSGSTYASLLPTVYIFVPELGSAIEALNYELQPMGEEYICRVKLEYDFDTALSAEEEIALRDRIAECLRELSLSGEGGYYAGTVEGREAKRADFTGMTAGIFFVGMFLSVVFLLATVLILYYKQVSEGYEDESRFAILQKLGMTGRDIRRSINSQLLTVFFLPLVMATVHLCFAFPMVQKLLLLFNLRNERLSLAVMAVTVLAFSVVYTLIYRVTSNAYYSIVIGARE